MITTVTDKLAPVLLLSLSVLMQTDGFAAASVPAAGSVSILKSNPLGAATQAKQINKAIEAGIAFLVENQNPNGSWGSARNTKGLNIFAPVPGAHHAFRSGVTSLCVSALIESGDTSEAVSRALDRAEAWMFEHMPKLRRATEVAIYNVWGHAYSISAFCTMLKRHTGDRQKCAEIRRQIRTQIELLMRYECVGGGWGYYDFEGSTQKPSDSTPSFVTATVLVALHRAQKDAGIEIDKGLINRSKALLRRQRKPDFSFVYSESHKYHPMSPVNRPGGSLGRAQTCNLAMLLWGDPNTTTGILESWLERLFKRNGWLDIGRKRPVPHESWFQVAGYFFYYGHFYAALCIGKLSEAKQPALKRKLADVLLPLQETDGSWWDYPFYDYHKPYGTAYAIMTLSHCLD